MRTIEAIHIFENINSNKYTSEEKCEAVYEVTKMPTHNSITKDSMVKAIEWLLDMAIISLPEVEEDADDE